MDEHDVQGEMGGRFLIKVARFRAKGINLSLQLPIPAHMAYHN